MKQLGEAITPFEHRAEAAIERVAAWREMPVRYELAAAAVVSPIHRAVASDCLIVETQPGAAPVFLKVRHEDMANEIDAPTAANSYRVAAARGTSPQVVLDQPEDGLLGLAFLPPPWRYAKVSDFKSLDTLAATIEAKKKLHVGSISETKFDVFARIEKFAVAARASGTPLPDDLDFLLAEAMLVRSAVAASGFDLAFCHNDGVASNIMLGPNGAVQLVDFDLAGSNDPWFDIAVLLNEAFQFDSDARAAIEIYGNQYDEALFNRCKLYATVDDLMWGLWGIYHGATSPRRKGIEFFKYGQWRLLRCRMAMQAWSFEEALRKL
jgi:thiamine kinase-like enzyme